MFGVVRIYIANFDIF